MLVSCIALAACSGELPATTDLPSKEQVAAAAIDQFATEFSQAVVDTSTVVVPAAFDLEGLRSHLATNRNVTTKPVGVIRYWEVLSVADKGDHWRVDLSSVDGANYFSGTLFFQIGDDGEVEQVDADDVGETLITSVS